MFDTIIFDFDGVIVDSVPLKTEAFVALYPEADAAQKDYIRQYQRQHGGVSRLHKIAHYETYLGRPAPTPEAVAGRAAEYQRLVENSVATCPMVVGAAEFLREQAGRYRMHLVSGTPGEELRRIVEARRLSGCFASITGSPPGKKDSFARILDRDAIGPDAAVAVGDSLTEYEAAAALGIAFVGIVAQGQPNPFPRDVPVLPDMRGLAAAIAGRPAQHHHDAVLEHP